MDDEPKSSGVKRRGFIGVTLLGGGAAIGALIQRSRPIAPTQKRTTLKSAFAYDVSEFEKTDPALFRYKPTAAFAVNFLRPRRIGWSPQGLWVAGDQALRLFSPAGVLQREHPLDFAPHALHVLSDTELLVAGRNHFVTLMKGNEFFRGRPAMAKYFTAIRAHNSVVYIADAGNREILMCDRKSGGLIDRFGAADASRNNPDFAIPSPYFNLEIDADQKLRIANTGQLRIETYSLDGHFESSWGQPGMRIDRFCGCCNPASFAITRDGNFVTSEKGIHRINLYSAGGAFLGAVAGPETLTEDKPPAREAEDSARAFDVTVDSENRVFALDPYKNVVRVFEPLPQT